MFIFYVIYPNSVMLKHEGNSDTHDSNANHHDEVDFQYREYRTIIECGVVEKGTK